MRIERISGAILILLSGVLLLMATYADIGGPYQRCGTHRKGDVRAIRQENGGPKPAVFQSSYSGMGTPLHN